MTAISDLTNEELDRKIAELRGWKECDCEWCKKNSASYWLNPVDDSCEDLPSFTTDPRYAMELLKEMCAKNQYVEIERDTYTNTGYVICGSLGEYCPTLYRAICEKWLEENE